jgi:hypothetical protein
MCDAKIYVKFQYAREYLIFCQLIGLAVKMDIDAKQYICIIKEANPELVRLVLGKVGNCVVNFHYQGE